MDQPVETKRQACVILLSILWRCQIRCQILKWVFEPRLSASRGLLLMFMRHGFCCVLWLPVLKLCSSGVSSPLRSCHQGCDPGQLFALSYPWGLRLLWIVDDNPYSAMSGWVFTVLQPRLHILGMWGTAMEIAFYEGKAVFSKSHDHHVPF